MLDETKLLQAGTLTYLPPDAQCPDSNDGVDDDDDGDDELYSSLELEATAVLDHSYSCGKLSLFTLNVIVYIAGWIIHKLSVKLSCKTCKESLLSNNPDNSRGNVFHLLKHKQNGGLLVPSQSMIYVVTSAEKHLRRMTNIHRVNPSLNLLRLQTCVLTDCISVKLFDSTHAVETQEGVENHRVSLIRSIVSTFFKLRQHHIVKLQNLRNQLDNCRYTLTKSILFKGQ